MNLVFETHCSKCGRARDLYSFASLHEFTGQSSQGSSASFGAAHQPTSEGASPKSGSPINIRHDVTPEETSTSLSKISKHAHGPWERKFPLEEPVDETQDHTYEQWIVDGILRDDSGDTRLSDDVEPKRVHGPSSDPESDLDASLGPSIKPRTDDGSSNDPDTSEQTRTKIYKGPLLPPVIYMLLVRVCGIVTRLFEPNPLPGRTRIRWRCVSYSRYVLLTRKCLFT